MCAEFRLTETEIRTVLAALAREEMSETANEFGVFRDGRYRTSTLPQFLRKTAQLHRKAVQNPVQLIPISSR